MSKIEAEIKDCIFCIRLVLSFAGIRSLIICVDRVDYLDMDQKDFQKLNHVQGFESLHGEN